MVWVMTGLLLALALWMGTKEVRPERPQLFSVRLAGGETIRCWNKEGEGSYLFLPGGTALESLTVIADPELELRLEDQPLEFGPFPAFAAVDGTYEISWRSGGGRESTRLTILRSENLPALFIDVDSGSMEYIHAKKGNQEAGSLQVLSAGGAQMYAGEIKSIQGRGNTTWTRGKKPYSLTLSGAADLLGMGEAERWVLLANSRDCSNLRNKLVYDFAGEIGLDYSPETRWVELYLNGEYAGLYLLTERNEVHPNRVNLGESRFLVSLELEERLRNQELPMHITQAHQVLRIHDNTLADGEMEAVLQQMENAILAEDGIDPVSGKSWEECIDLDSWAKKYLIEEVFANFDGATLSQFFYYDTSLGKIYAGPVWDYDLTLGSIDFWGETGKQALYGNRRQINVDEFVEWFYALCKKEAFQSRVETLYETLFLPKLEALLETGLGTYDEIIARSAGMNAVRWYIGENAYENECLFLREFLEDRMGLLEKIWLNHEPYCTLQIRMNDGDYIRFVLEPGEVPDWLPDPSSNAVERFVRWYYADTGEPFDKTRPIYEDTVVLVDFTDGTLYTLGYYGPPVVLLLIFAGLLLADKGRRGGAHGAKRNRKLPA